MVLFMRKIELHESLALDIEQVASAGKNYLYPVRQIKIVTYQKGPTIEDFSQTDILPGEEELLHVAFSLFLFIMKCSPGIIHPRSLQLPTVRHEKSGYEDSRPRETLPVL